MIVKQESNGVVVLKVEHGKANALDKELCLELRRTMEEVESASAIVLTGRGRIFSAGVDLVRLVGDDAAYRSDLLLSLAEAFEALFYHSRPVVAAINGHAIAGGCILACAADYRIMTSDGGARIGVPELTVGVPFPPVALEIMRSSVPPQHLRRLLLRGLTYDSEQALKLGVVDEVVADGALMDRALACAGDLASLPDLAFALTKAQLCQPVRERVQQAWTGEMASQVNDAWNSPAVLDAVRRYVKNKLKK